MKALPLFAVVMIALLSGCSRSSGNIVGKWKVDPALSGASASPEDKGFVIGFGSTFHFEFKIDKTFVGAITEGTYTLDGGKLSMKTTKVLGQDVSKASPSAGAEAMTGN